MFNILDTLWGPRRTEYVDLERKMKVLRMNQFKDDQYVLDMTLRAVHSFRVNGPKWARRPKAAGFVVDWISTEGIPLADPRFAKPDMVFYDTERIDNPANWWVKSRISLYKKIEADRTKYSPPTTRGVFQGPKIDNGGKDG